MPKGVKKIKCVKGLIFPKKSVLNKTIVIAPDQFVYFQVSEWDIDTTTEDKKKPITWLFQDQDKKTIHTKVHPASENCGIKIPKALCGAYTYYLEASLSGKKDSRNTGLNIYGFCPPKIISSKWATSRDGKDVRTTHQFFYGNTIYLYLKTEGLNGLKNLLVEIHRNVKGGKGTEDDQLIHVYTGVSVVDGIINFPITDTFLWQGKIAKKNDIEKFYIKLKNPVDGSYIKDNNNDILHATFLRIKNKIELTPPKPPENKTVVKIGETEKSYKNYQPCKFSKITISCKEKNDAVIFDEGKFIRKIDLKDNSIQVERILYDFDKWNIRADAKPILESVKNFLLDPPYLPVEIGSHTDCRGSDEYNYQLSKKRAQAVVDYLIAAGIDPIKIVAKGYGKTKLLNKGENISEELHQENRRTTLRFRVFNADVQTLLHNVIVPSQKLPRELKIRIDAFSRTSCFKKKVIKTKCT